MKKQKSAPLGRWGICLHEAGHLVLGCILLGETSAHAVVLGNDMGQASVNVGEHLTSWRAALVVAAGPVAERLAERYAAPRSAPRPVPSLRPPKSRKARTIVANRSMYLEYEAAISGGVSDEQRISIWTMAAKETRSSGWARRRYLTFFNAWRLVQKYEQIVVSAARILYHSGIVRASDLNIPITKGIPHAQSR